MRGPQKQAYASGKANRCIYLPEWLRRHLHHWGGAQSRPRGSETSELMEYAGAEPWHRCRHKSLGGDGIAQEHGDAARWLHREGRIEKQKSVGRFQKKR